MADVAPHVGFVGEGAFRYEPLGGWGRLPAGYALREAVGVAVDAQDRVFVFAREEHPVLVFDRAGHFLFSWGDGQFVRPHGIVAAPDGTVWCTDDWGNAVRRYTPEGRLVAALATPGAASDTGVRNRDYRTIVRAAGPFNLPTNVALSPEGDVYVADGYGNARVHKFAPDGRLLLSWGEAGSGPGQFHVPHGVAVAPDGTVFVCDRENSRIQRFTPRGEFIDAWADVVRPCKATFDRDGNAFVAELGFQAGMYAGNHAPERPAGSRVSVFGPDGALRARWGGSERVGSAGDFFAAHDIAIDSRGDLYVGEVRPGMYGMGNARVREAPPGAPVLQKFARPEGATLRWGGPG